VIEISGVSAKHEGNWYVVAIRQTIQGGSATLARITLKRNASNSPVSNSTIEADKVNNKPGKNKENTKTVVSRDVNGNVID